VALRPEDKKRVDQLTEAAAHLRSTGKDEWADTVDFVLTPDGRAFLNRLRVDRLRQEESEGKFGYNLALAMPLEVREEIKATAARKKASLPDEARKAMEAFLDGKFVPAKPQRATRGSGGEKVNLNIRVDPELRKRAEDYGADHAAQFGWAPRASHIIIGWLVQRFTEAGK
jgi:plasmid stability protein